MENNLYNIWFICDKCGTAYDDDLEEIVDPKDIRGTIEWANSPTSTENRWEALDKLKVRMKYENKKCESKRENATESSTGQIKKHIRTY